MPSKDRVRKKFLLIRKKKYFLFKDNFFKPLIKLIKNKKKKKISLYYPSNYEEDAIKLFKIISKLKKKLVTSLPVIDSSTNMRFIKWKPIEPLKINRYGFLEPAEKINTLNPDLIIVPLVAFDKFHNRLGYGKGYYDRFLKGYIKKNKNILTIGLAFSFQKYTKIPTSKFDIKLDYILTEKGIF